MLRPYPDPRQKKAPDHQQSHGSGTPVRPTLVLAGNKLQGTAAVRSTSELRLHPVFIKLGLVGTLIDHRICGQKPPDVVPEPILTTSGGTIISGVREWHTAVSDARETVYCTEYQLNDDEALQVILTHQQSSNAWNAFIRTQVALQLESYYQTKAHANRVAGGKNKGLANLPEADHIDVRQEIAYLADNCPRNVSKVKTILLKAHARLIEICQTGIISIDRAYKLCGLAREQQVEELARCFHKSSCGEITRKCIANLRMEKLSPKADFLLRILLQREAREPGTIIVKGSTRRKTLVLIGEDDWDAINAAVAETDVA